MLDEGWKGGGGQRGGREERLEEWRSKGRVRGMEEGRGA